MAKAWSLTSAMLVLVLSALMFSNSVLLLCDARTSPELKITLPHGGTLVGRHLSSHKGRSLLAFMGVPYAQPPIGELRFMPPVPVAPWKGERLAISDASKCIQRDPFRRDMLIEGSEDCLYLNIYAPEKPRTPANRLLPIMVWFHGGGWQCGSGISAFYGPDYLMDHDIVLVSANFRLGPLGFLSTETVDCPGNFGLKDQLEVLRWVQTNIAAFGGDPNSVTIFGESAGGASVTYFMLAEQARGLFHKGIVQSGTYLNPWAQPGHTGVPAKRAAEVAKLVECVERPEDAALNWADTMTCLRSRPAEDIVATLYKLFEWDQDPMIPFPPVVEPQHETAFLTHLPRDSQGDSHGLSLPLMIGITSEEGLLRTAALLNLPGLLDEFKQRFNEFLPITLYYNHHSLAVQNQISEKIEKFYFKHGHDYNRQQHQNLTDLISDGWFVAGIDEYIRMRFRHQEQARKTASEIPPTFVYLFEHKGAASFSEIFHGGREEYYGACHAEELQYLFPVGDQLFVTAVPTKRDIELRDAMLTMWVNFANNSNPTPTATTKTTNLSKWKPATEYPVTYFHIGDKLGDSSTNMFRNDRGLYQDRVNFWEDIRWAHLPAKEETDNTIKAGANEL